MTPAAIRWTLVAVLLLAWEALPRLGMVPALFLPPLTAAIGAGITDAPTYAAALAVTIGEVAVAALLACGGGILAGAVLGGVASVRQLLLPLVSSLYAVPIVILYPAMTAWFGLGSGSKIAFAALYAVFPTALAMAAGMRTIDPNLLLAARSMGARPLQLLLRVVLPAAIPTVLAALRLGGALCIVGVVVAEMLVSTAGVGFLVTGYRTTLDSPHVFAAVLLVVAVIALFDGGVRWAERRAAGWINAGRMEAP
ncbi:MAG: ABC transporter permease [Janthinobacterium lividum]